MRVLPTLLALSYAGLSAVTGIFTALVGLYDSEALAVLGLAWFGAGVFAAGALLGGSRVGDAALGLHALLLVVLAVLTAEETSDVVLLAYILTFGTGLALRRVTASSRPGARGTPADRSV
jgi:hypothetical protein